MIKNQTNQKTNSRIKEIILDTVKKQKPETAKQLISLMQERHGIPPEQTTNLLVELENEGHMRFTKLEPTTTASAKTYMFSQTSLWYWITIFLVVATTITVFTIPDSDYPLAYLRNAMGVLFVLFLPGYAFIQFLFPTKLPRSIAFLTKGQLGTGNESMATIERVALSIGLSLALVPIVGLILNYTPWGIRLAPITLSLLALTFVFATAAIGREYQKSIGLDQKKR